MSGATELLPRPATVRLDGMTLSALTRQEVVSYVFESLARGRGGWIITSNVDHFRSFSREPDVRALFASASLVCADGVPLLWAARVQGTPLPDRVAGSDLVWLLAERAAREERSLFLLGGRGDAARKAATRLSELHPDLRIAGVANPRVSAEPTQDELASIRELLLASRPQLVYVALGAPKQERVIAALRESLPSSWWIGVGISLSFMAGEIARAPAWMQRVGLEWLHRLAQEPRRLMRRYLLHDLPCTVGLLARALRARIAGPPNDTGLRGAPES